VGLDFFSRFDYGLGQRWSGSIVLFFIGGLSGPLFMLSFGSYWYASCRESSFFSNAGKFMSRIVEGGALSRSPGSLQLILSLWVCLFSLRYARLLPFAHPMMPYMIIT